MKKLQRFERVVLVALGLTLSPGMLQAAEGVAAAPPSQAAQPAPQAAVKAAAKAESTINVNKASADELAAGLAGVGPAKAKAIVAYREANGPFKDSAQLLKVKGIGEAILKQNEGKIVF